MRIATIAGIHGERVAVCREQLLESDAIALEVQVRAVRVIVGLDDDEVRQLVAALEVELRLRSTARRLDPEAECWCGHRRGVHEELHGACRDDSACPCMVMRPTSVVPATVQSCTTAPLPRGSDQDAYPYGKLRLRSFRAAQE